VNNTDSISCDGSNNIIEGNNVRQRGIYYGISMTSGSSNAIKGNIIELYGNGYGIYISNAGIDNVVAGNSIVNCYRGVYALKVQKLRIEGNNLTDNLLYHIEAQGLNSSTITGNNICGRGCGLSLSGYGNTIFSNNIANCSTGISIGYSSDNLFYHNNFINNTRHVYTFDLYDAWDNGYPSGGNYWDNYTGVDGNGDGIGDTPYVISGYNIDRYPLIEPIVIPEFQSVFILALLMTATLPAVMVYRRKHSKRYV
jgi:parallel beta-helix repeat protein